MATDPYRPLADALQRSVVESPGALDPAIRRAAFAGEVPEPFREYVEKVRQHAYTVVDRDVEALREAGYSDDQLFELTLATALGAGMRRLDAGLRALGDEG